MRSPKRSRRCAPIWLRPYDDFVFDMIKASGKFEAEMQKNVDSMVQALVTDAGP